MRSLSKLLAVAIVAAGCAPSAIAETADAIESYVLPNGLTVVMAPDHRVPKVAVTLQYRVGAVNEPAGRSGFAHLFEHLMFTGTPAYPDIDATWSALGLAYNATTEQDATTYFASGMASTLPVILSVQADQMGNLGGDVTQAELDLERSVVRNEMRQNTLDSPGGSALVALQTGMFPPSHPYHRATIGSIADLDAATVADVRAFFDLYYVPANAVLVVVGDIGVAATRKLVDDTFGRIARSPASPAPSPAEVVPTRVRIESTDAVATPTIYVGFTGPTTTLAEDAALLVAADLLNSPSGPLKSLVNEGIATFAGADWSPGDLGGIFTLVAGAAPGMSAEDLETRLRTAVASFVASPIDPADLERSRSAFLLGYRTALEGLAPRSQFIAGVMRSTGKVEGILDVPPELLAVSAADVEREMRRILVDADASVAVVQPGPRGNYPAVLTGPSGEAQPLQAAERAPVAIPMLTAGEPKAALLPSRETATLSNGIKVVHYRMAGAPMAYLSVVVGGGQNNDPRGKEGIYEMSLEMATHGAAERNEADFAEVLRDTGASIGTWVGMSRAGVVLSVVPEKLQEGVDLLADVVQEPRFDAQPWAVLKAQTLQYLAQRESDPDSAAYRALDRLVFFPGPDDAGLDISPTSIEGLTLEDARDTYNALFVPSTMSIYSVSDLPVASVVAALEPRFGGWTEAGKGIVAKPPLQPVFPDHRTVYVVPIPGAAQATIFISRPAPGADDAAYADAVAVTNLLAGDFSSRLNAVIREQKGYSYGVSAYLWSWLRHHAGLTVAIPVQSDATGAALTEAMAGFESLVSAPVTEAELRRSVMSYLSVQAGLPETAAGFFGALVGWEKDGVELDSLIRFLDRMTELKLPDVRAAAADLAGLDHAVVIVAGDPAVILPQLEAAGINDVETVDLAATLP